MTLHASQSKKESLSPDVGLQSKLNGLLPFKIPPWRHQLAAIKEGVPRDCYALFMDPGVGKTATAINILRHKYFYARRLFPTLVLCPPIVIENWRREILAHSTIRPTEILLLMGSGKDRLRSLKSALEKNGDIIVVTNYETLLMPAVFELLMQWHPRCLVADEVHRCKDIKAKRTKAVVALADRADVSRLILTGTPVLNSPMDLFAQFRILDQGKSFGTNFFVFRNTYFHDKNYLMPRHRHFPDWRPQDGALEKINQIIGAAGVRVEKKDCLDLPPLVRKVIHVPLSPKQRKLYEEMRDDFIAYLNDKACVANLAITKALRLQQICSGYVVLEEEDGSQSTVEIKENPRAETLKELLSEITPRAKVIVWCVFRQNYAVVRAVCTALGLSFVEVTGEIKEKQRQQAIDALESDDNCRVLIGHPGSGGIGANMVAAAYAINYSRGFSLEHDIQSRARNYRGGSERHESIIQIDLVAPGTIDERVMKALADKEEIGHRLLRQIQSEI